METTKIEITDNVETLQTLVKMMARSIAKITGQASEQNPDKWDWREVYLVYLNDVNKHTE